MIDDSAWVQRMSGLTRDGTADPFSRDQILRRERGQGNINLPCSADHTSRIDSHARLIFTLLNVLTILKHILHT